MKKLFFVFFLFSFEKTFSQEITFKWNNLFGGTGRCSGQALESDKEGFIYSAGYFEGKIKYKSTNLDAEQGRDGFLFKLDTNGNIIWSKQFSSSKDVSIDKIAIDNVNSIYILGTYKNYVQSDFTINTNNKDSIYSTNFFIAKYDNQGNIIWSKNTSGISYNGNSISLDKYNNLYIVGKCASIEKFDTLIEIATLDSTFYSNRHGSGWQFHHPKKTFLAKYNSNGSKIWVKPYYGNPQNILIDYENNIVITGSINDTTKFDNIIVPKIGTETSYLSKQDTNGSVLWVKTSGGSANWNSGYGLAIDENNNIFQSGQLLGNDVYFDDSIKSNYEETNSFLSKYNRNGKLVWYKIYGDNNSGIDEPNFNCGNVLKFDKEKNIVFLGYFLNSCSFDTSKLKSYGAYDVMLLKIDSNGKVHKSSQYSDFGWVDAYGLTFDAHNNIYICGTNSQKSWSSADPFYGYIGKIESNMPTTKITLNLSQIKNIEETQLYPNPTNKYLNVFSPKNNKIDEIEIRNIDGKLYNKYTNFETSNNIQIEVSGTYIVKLISDKNILIKKIIVESK